MANQELYSQLKNETNRVKKLEEACKRQEAVITEMEMQLAERSGIEGQKGCTILHCNFCLRFVEQ